MEVIYIKVFVLNNPNKNKLVVISKTKHLKVKPNNNRLEMKKIK